MPASPEILMAFPLDLLQRESPLRPQPPNSLIGS